MPGVTLMGFTCCINSKRPHLHGGATGEKQPASLSSGENEAPWRTLRARRKAFKVGLTDGLVYVCFCSMVWPVLASTV